MDQLSYEERLVRCSLVSLELRRLRKDLALCYQIVNGLISLNFTQFFEPDPNYKTRGNRQKLKIPKLSHSTARTNFFAVRIVHVWNSLADEIILCGKYLFIYLIFVSKQHYRNKKHSRSIKSHNGSLRG
jgi:hypothetical protein